MITLKFGGTSVSNAQNIKLVLDIVQNKSKEDKLAVVVSAFSGVTDMLLEASKKAAQKDKSYREIISQIEKKHKDAIEELILLSEQNELLSVINNSILELKTI